MNRVLLIEDERAFAKLLQRALERDGTVVECANNVPEGLEKARAGDFDVVLTDLYLGSSTALELISHLRQHKPRLPVIIMTSKHTTETAIEATKHGAYDYFAKPDAFDFDVGTHLNWPWILDLSEMIEKAAQSGRTTARVRLPDDTVTAESVATEDQMIGKSRAMQQVFKEIGRAAASDVTVLIRGETGTGKELAARALFSHSRRAGGPFIVVHSAAIPENLLEAELFGHEKGAFTGAHTRRVGRFEQADHGTIFLDEIGDMSLFLQQKLLRVLQEKTIERVGGKETIAVDVRIIAATHRDLELAVQDQLFREDLFFRLNVASITLPPLRDRREDIPELVNYFLRKHAAELGSGVAVATPEAIALLQELPWPGNIRHLRNILRKALLLARGLAIDTAVVREALAQMTPPRLASDQSFSDYVKQLLAHAPAGEAENVYETVMEVGERELYSQAIRRAHGDQTKAAQWLGVSRPTMLEKLRKFGLHPAER